ncbi:MAG: hypothetical protein IKZ50_00845 [Bacteroidales bacterium]|nr:hypothetical protein [Bacteroidales bacterium]
MKKIVLMMATLLVATNVIAQTKEEISASVTRAQKLSELCKKFPKATGVPEVDAHANAVLNAAESAVKNSEKLENLYYRQIGETKDGVTDVTIVKPSLDDILELSASIADEGDAVAKATKLSEDAAKKAKEIKNPLKAAKLAAMTKFTSDATPILLEESAAQAKAIASMVETAKSASNL